MLINTYLYARRFGGLDSLSEARRLVRSGAVKINDKPVTRQWVRARPPEGHALPTITVSYTTPPWTDDVPPLPEWAYEPPYVRP